MRISLQIFVGILCLLVTLISVGADKPYTLTWGADKRYSPEPSVRVDPKADVLAAVLDAAKADPLITAHASTDASKGQAVYSTPVPDWLTTAIRSRGATYFGFPAFLEDQTSLLLVREAALPALGRALTALSPDSADSADSTKYAALVGPAGQGKSTQLLTLATMALVEAGGRDVVLYNGPDPAAPTRPEPLFLHFKNINTTAVYESFDAVKAAGLNKPSTVLIYDGNARYEQGVVDLFTGACILTALRPGYDDNAFAMRKSTVTRVHVPPLAPSEFAAIVGAVWPYRTAEDIGWAVKRFGLSVRHARWDIVDTYIAADRASKAVAKAFKYEAYANKAATGASDEELLGLCKAGLHRHDSAAVALFGTGVRALIPAVRDAETDETRCVFASAEARRAVVAAADKAFAKNRAKSGWFSPWSTLISGAATLAVTSIAAYAMIRQHLRAAPTAPRPVAAAAAQVSS